MRTVFIVALLASLASGCSDSDGMANNTSIDFADNMSAEGKAVGASGPIFCDEVKIMTTRADCDYFTRLRGEAKAGLGAFNVPREMWRGQAVPIQLAVSMSSDRQLIEQYQTASDVVAAEDALLEHPAQNMTASLEDPGANGSAGADDPAAGTLPPDRLKGPAQTVRSAPGATVPFVPIVGRFMRADLSGAGFAVKALSERDQEVIEGSTTVWNWEVTPTEAFESGQRLTLTTAVLARGADGKVRVLQPTVTNKTVVVKVTAMDRARAVLKGIPEWIGYATAILVALGALFAAWRKLRGGGPSTPPPPAP